MTKKDLNRAAKWFALGGILALLLWVVIMISADAACAGTKTCPNDLTNAPPTTKGYDLKPTNPCLRCRELNAFPNDFNNAAWNYVKHGVGEFVFMYYYETLDGHTAQTRFAVRSCSMLGQCATTLILTTFDVIGTTIFGVPVQDRVGVSSWKLVTNLPDGSQHVRVYYPESVEKVEPFPIPSPPGADDGYEPGTDCLTNTGALRVTSVPTGGTSAGGSVTVTPVSGYDGGGYGTIYQDCYRIITRDGSGSIIGNTVQCVLTRG